jgi:hypothetical protein
MAKLMDIRGLNLKFRLPAAVALTLAGFLIQTTAQAQQAPAPLLSIFENVTLSPDFAPNPTTVRGISGGPLAASNIAERSDTATGPCAGFVDEQPDHTMQLTDFFDYLQLQVQSPQDTTLVVRGPGGSWCNDDYEGKNPGIAGQWLSGTYEIWIGSYEENSYHPYIIRITETR